MEHLLFDSSKDDFITENEAPINSDDNAVITETETAEGPERPVRRLTWLRMFGRRR